MLTEAELKQLTPEGVEWEMANVWINDYRAHANRRSETSQSLNIHSLRSEAIQRFTEIGFPKTHWEDWRFTNVSPIARRRFRRPAKSLPKVPAATLARLTWEAAATLVFVDGRFVPELSQRGELPEGVYCGSLAEALDRRSSLPALPKEGKDLSLWLGAQASFEMHPFVALNTAYFEDGAFLWLPKGAVIERPIHLLFLTAGSGGSGEVGKWGKESDLPVGAFPRNLIVAGESSQVRVVETYAAVGSGKKGVYLNSPVTELYAGPNAVVDHYKVQRESHEAFHMATFALRQDRSSNVSSHSISLGGGLVRNDVNALLDGEGSETILNGLYMIAGKQFVDHHMRVEHAKPHCNSHELFKGVLGGHARSIFNGLIHVRHGAQKTDAKQSNRNLLLSKDAVANSNPQLEIFADDVKCTHGSTVGQLDDDAIFYLRSRGIGAEAARSLLTYAFASDIVERIKVEPVRKDLEEFLFTALPKGEVVRQAV